MGALGEYISKKIAKAEWGAGVVDYRDEEKVSPLVRQLPWTHHLLILGQVKGAEGRHFYRLSAIRGHWTKRELERQMQPALSETTKDAPPVRPKP